MEVKTTYDTPVPTIMVSTPNGIVSLPLEISDDYWQMRLRVLQTEINYIRKMLGENPKRCSKCGEELK